MNRKELLQLQREIKSLIAQNRIEEAILKTRIVVDCSQNNQIGNQFLIINNRYNREKTKFIKGTKENEVEDNKINYALSILLDDAVKVAQETISRPFPLNKINRYSFSFIDFFCALLINIELFILIKKRLFPDWSNSAFLKDITIIISFFSLFALLLFLIQAAKARVKSVRNTFGVLGALLLTLSFATFTIKQAPYLEKVYFYISNHNWDFAEKEFNALDQRKLKPELVKTFEYFIATHKESDTHAYPEGQVLRSRKNAVENLISKKFDYKLMNSLALAEIYKSLYFAEDDKDHIRSAINYLKQKKGNINVHMKRGELTLAMKDYEKAKEEFTNALNYRPNPTQLSIIQLNLGNISATLGNVDGALEKYREAEENYPAIKKFVFYSNYSYLLMLAGKYKLAEEKVRYALKINSTDWYSYLNLGLIQEKQGSWLDAIHNLDAVMQKSDNVDAKREAGIFKGRCMEIAGYDRKEFVETYLQALNMNTASESVDYYSNNIKTLYKHIIRSLQETNTHGIEVYIKWFEDRV